MTCSSPLPAVRLSGINPSTGKQVVVVGRSALDYFDRSGVEQFFVPCGQCMACRINRSREWADRCLLELQSHDFAEFVTLTYDDYHVPVSWYADKCTGEAFPSLTLRYRDVQLFLKRLRKMTGQFIRYFGCSEYGDTTQRPHYHIILFGLRLDDKVAWQRNRLGEVLYRSPTLERAWSVKDIDGVYRPIGYVLTGAVNWNSCAYVARYVTKKKLGVDAVEYETFNLEPPRSMMSLKPAIGRQYYDLHKDEIYNHRFLYVSAGVSGGRKIRPPRYYDRLYDIDYPDVMADIKARRVELAQSMLQLKLSATSLNEYDLRRVEDDAFQARIKSLRRDCI